MANGFKYATMRELSNTDLDKMTTRDLKDFIRAAKPYVEQSFKSTETQMVKSMNIVSERFGVRMVHGEPKLVGGYSGNRDELLTRAEILKAHMSVDVFSHRAEEELEMVSDAIMDKINKSLSTIDDNEENILNTEDIIRTYWFLNHELKNIIKDFGSTEIATIMESQIEENYGELGDKEGTDLLTLIVKVFKDSQGKGLDKDQFVDLVTEEIRRRS